jgi:hypothetical protein
MTSILDDKLLSTRLAGNTEFQLRLAEFLCSYRIVDRPSLVLQARPPLSTGKFNINVDAADVQRRFLAGTQTQNGWWQGFRAMTAVRHTFHGIGSLPQHDDPEWASELHRDGHFIAGIWKFPPVPHQGATVEILADFYTDIFWDFLRLIEATLAGALDTPKYEATWTVVNAPRLHYGGGGRFGQPRVTALPLQIPHLQWPISAATVGAPEWQQLALQMSDALAGAYGDTPASRQR